MINKIDKAEKGKRAESLAIKALKKRRYRIVARNWRCRYGEIDCIATQGEYLVIVEVKSGAGELPIEKIDRAKQKKLSFLAQLFAEIHGLENMPVRFDAAIVDAENKHVEIIENAF